MLVGEFVGDELRYRGTVEAEVSYAEIVGGRLRAPSWRTLAAVR